MDYEELKTRKAYLLKELSEVEKAIERAKFPLIKDKLEQVETLFGEIYQLNQSRYDFKIRDDVAYGDFDDLRQAINIIKHNMQNPS
jgi:hypothetical protein